MLPSVREPRGSSLDNSTLSHCSLLPSFHSVGQCNRPWNFQNWKLSKSFSETCWMLSEHDGFERMMINLLLGVNFRETQNSFLDIRSITDLFYSSGNRDLLLYVVPLQYCNAWHHFCSLRSWQLRTNLWRHYILEKSSKSSITNTKQKVITFFLRNNL